MDMIEVVKAFSDPIDKLIDSVSRAIGKAYEPKHIREMADAKSYEIKRISEIIRNNSDIPIVYNSEGISIDTRNYEEIAKRASSRLAYQEIIKQQNIESVVDNAYEELEKVDSVSDDPINSDWMIRFFNSVEDISDESLQKIWGRILAGEIKRPNSYSYRTLEKLKNMTQKEVEYFQIVSSLVLKNSNINFILDNKDLMNKYNVYFGYILKLEECGLMTSQSLSLNLEVSNSQYEFIYNSKIIGVIKGKEDNLKKIVLPCYFFTESGSQLLDSIVLNVNSKYIIECIKLISNKYKEFIITAHNIECIDNKGYVTYDKIDILV